MLEVLASATFSTKQKMDGYSQQSDYLLTQPRIALG